MNNYTYKFRIVPNAALIRAAELSKTLISQGS
jgi:hypothetical protein